jgi:hypothetical protein
MIQSLLRKSFASVLVFTLMLLIGGREAQAQVHMMSLPPHASTYTGYSRGFWFTAPTDFFLEGVRIPTSASATADQHAYIVRFTAPPPGLPGTTAYTVLGEWYNVSGNNIIDTKILINAGDHIGVIGHRGNLPATNFSAINSYGTGPHNSAILGNPVSLYRLMYQDNILNTYTNNPGAPMPLGAATSGQIGRVELYVGPPCIIPDGSFDLSITDANGAQIGFTTVPSTVYVDYAVRYPEGSSDVTLTLEFRRIGEQNPEHVVTFNTVKPDGADLVARQAVVLPASLPPGYYLIRPTITSLNSCEEMQDTELPEELLLVIPPGATLCSVWPGDANNDGVVNYADRRDLNRYIHEANLRASWLTGPARFMHDAETNPMTYVEWKQQPGIPWNTPEGCYMDTDGNGIINNFDYIAIKLNWMRTHGAIGTKDAASFSPVTFDMDQNYPNPFNPTTSIRYSAPETSHVTLTVTDMLGRTVATLVDGTVDSGVHTVSFDGANLTSGNYMATIRMVGVDSELGFSKTIKMVLNK